MGETYGARVRYLRGVAGYDPLETEVSTHK